MATVPTTLTHDDLERMPDDGRRYELIGGEIVESPSPSQAQQELVLRLVLLLEAFVRAGKLGRIILAPFEVRLSDRDAVQPDILFVSNTRLGILGENHAVGAPDLVIEVLSPSTRARDEGGNSRCTPPPRFASTGWPTRSGARFGC